MGNGSLESRSHWASSLNGSSESVLAWRVSMIAVGCLWGVMGVAQAASTTLDRRYATGVRQGWRWPLMVAGLLLGCLLALIGVAWNRRLRRRWNERSYRELPKAERRRTWTGSIGFAVILLSGAVGALIAFDGWAGPILAAMNFGLYVGLGLLMSREALEHGYRTRRRARVLKKMPARPDLQIST
jgi:uncharacterized membrane protein HdeD (DUF308 family)